MNHTKNIVIVLFLVSGLLLGCKKQWDDRTAVADQQLDKSLLQKIEENADLSTFTGFLKKLGYDKVLISSRTFTIWAPNNQALQGLDPAITADTAKLRQFVNNHISNQAYLTTDVAPARRIRTLNGKKVTFTPSGVEDAAIVSADGYVNNGVLHVINKALIPKMNISEYIRSLSTQGLAHKAYILRQDTVMVDTTKATVASIDPITGKPILVPGTGLVNRNKYFTSVADLANEDSLYTYFVLTDDAYNAERNKVSRFFATSSVDTTMNILAAYNVLKDVAVRGAIQQADLPASLVSVKGVAIPVDRSAIVQSYTGSNGIVYVMNRINFKVEDKIPPIFVQGEAPTGFLSNSYRNNTQYRTKKDNNQVLYSDLQLSGSGLLASFYARYRLSNLYTCQYKVIWRAINDYPFATATNLSQRLGFSQRGYNFVSSTSTAYTAQVQFPYVAVTPLNYAEFTLTGATANASTPIIATPAINATAGTLNVLKYGSVDMFLQGPASTTNNVFTLDYVKLIPIY